MKIISKGIEMENHKFVVWTMQGLKLVSFTKREGYYPNYFHTQEELWKTVHTLLDTGYKVH